MQSNIVVVGSSNVDMVAKVQRLPKPGETVGNAVFSQTFGGKGANQAIAARRAGGQVSLITCLGKDIFGQQMQQAFTSDGINTDHVMYDHQQATGTAMILVDAQGENIIAVAPGANESLTPALIDEARFLISGAELILLQMEIPIATVTYLLELAGSLGKKVMLNPSPAHPLEERLMKRLYMLIMNETETAVMTGMTVKTREDVIQAAEEVLKKGVEHVVVTLGEKGSYFASKREKKWVDAYRVQAVDTTGAGDVFCGALASALHQQLKLQEAMKFASAAAALSVTRMGAQSSAPSLREIRAFLNEHEF